MENEWFSDDLRKLDDDNVFRKIQGHWIIEMAEMLATCNARSVEDIKSFLSRQSETYKVPYETHPEDRPRQCIFVGSSNNADFLPFDLSLIHISEPTRLGMISYAVFCLKKKKKT